MQPAFERAIFTSIRSGRLEGYQLAAASPGLSERDRQELTRWGPAHDALLDPGPRGESINFHQLASGNYCVSHTVHAGAEYSGRGGLRVFTVMLLASSEALARFANNPFRLLEAATAAGYADVLDPASERLEPIQLSCVATPVDRILLARLARHPGPHAMAALVDGILREGLLAVESRVPLRRLIAGLFSLLPVELRPLFSFSTGLKLSRQRSFRIQPLDPDTPRGGARRAGDPVPLLLDQRASQLEVSHPWSELASHVLCTGAAASLCQALSIPRPDLLGPFDQASRNLAALAQRLGKAAREPLAVG